MLTPPDTAKPFSEVRVATAHDADKQSIEHGREVQVKSGTGNVVTFANTLKKGREANKTVPSDNGRSATRHEEIHYSDQESDDEFASPDRQAARGRARVAPAGSLFKNSFAADNIDKRRYDKSNDTRIYEQREFIRAGHMASPSGVPMSARKSRSRSRQKIDSARRHDNSTKRVSTLSKTSQG